ncbi:MAG TPA: hypothetical protein VGD99_18080 [Anaerolineae bacterium]
MLPPAAHWPGLNNGWAAGKLLFNSVQFLIFFPVIAACYFYMSWKPDYIILIIISTLVDYFVTLEMGRTEGVFRRKLLLTTSLSVNLGVLFGFKYFRTKILHQSGRFYVSM